MATILLINKDSGIGEAVQRAIAETSYSLVSAESLDEALDMLRTASIDLFIVNLESPVLDETYICRRLRNSPNIRRTPILCIANPVNSQEIAQILDAGGDDCIRKPVIVRELAARIRVLLRRPHYVSSATLALVLNEREKTVQLHDRNIELTPTEFDLLHALCRRPGEPIPAARLLQEVWNYPPGLGDPALVRNHVRNLRRKLENDPDRPHIVTSSPKRGYLVNIDIRKS